MPPSRAGGNDKVIDRQKPYVFYSSLAGKMPEKGLPRNNLLKKDGVEFTIEWG